MNSINKNTVFVIVVLSVALGIGIWRNKNPIGNSGNNILQPTVQKVLPDFKLTEAVSKTEFSHKNLLGQWSFLFFGYSACPDVCPATIDSLNKLSAELPHQPGVQYIFISIDPEKDTPEALATFLTQEKFQPSLIKGLTGDKKQIMALASTIGIFVNEHPSQPTLSGPIEHSGTIILMNPQGQLAAVYTNTENPKEIAQNFQKLYQKTANLNRLKPAMPS